MNPRYPFGVYTISNRARSASYATSPYRFLSSSVATDWLIIQHSSLFVNRYFKFFQNYFSTGKKQRSNHSRSCDQFSITVHSPPDCLLHQSADWCRPFKSHFPDIKKNHTKWCGSFLWRRRRDLNPRYPFGVYTISNRARSASYATSPYRS